MKYLSFLCLFFPLYLLFMPLVLEAAPAGVGDFEPRSLEDYGSLYVMNQGDQSDGQKDILTKILVVGTTTGNNLINGLRSYFATVDYYDATTSTPSLATLQQYGAIVTYSGWGSYQDYVTLGNNVANFVDTGGGVVLTSLNHYDGGGYYLGGRMLDATYMTINRGGGNGTVVLGSYNASHWIMRGVTAVTATYSIAATTPYFSAKWVATWSDGLPGVYVAPNNKVVGINMYVQDQSSNGGNWILLIRNALEFTGRAGLASVVDMFEAFPLNRSSFIEWSTNSELFLMGFELFRAETWGGPYQVIGNMLPAHFGSPEGFNYYYQDNGLKNWKEYWYQLKIIFNSGDTEYMDPVRVSPGLDNNRRNESIDFSLLP